MKTLAHFLQEGVYDQAIFKAFVLAGGPGSGKSFVAGKTMLGFGLKVVNSDDIFELLMRQHNLDFKMPPEEQEVRDALRDRARALSDKQMQHFLNGRLGLVIDGTGRDYDKIAKIHDMLKNKYGYDVYMTFVNTSLETALERNKMRPRSVPEDVVKEAWQAVQNNMGKFQRLFGQSNFIVVDNNDASEDVFQEVWKHIRKLVNKPVKNKKAKKWIAQELELKRQD